MRILTTFQDRREVQELRFLLDANGIPTQVIDSGIETQRRWTVSVCINSQYEDALALIENPDHEVEEGVDVGAFYTDAHRFDTGTMSRALLKLFAAAVAFRVIVIFLVTHFGRS